MTKPYPWWQKGIVYQVYPRSFMDSNGDGVGDLPGITARLGYLRWLRVDAVWISPFYPSPMADFGYDVTDHCNVDPHFGTLANFDHLLAEAHTLGIRIILDYIPNHTSDRHPWFRESRASRDNPKRNWYIWRDPAPDGGLPNNWLSAFGGSAWAWDDATQQYYYHAFLREQPDLNWNNPAVEAAMLNVLRFWFSRGVDGVRVDAVQQIAKDPLFRDNPPNPAYVPGPGYDPFDALLRVHSCDRPEVHERIARMRGVLADYGADRVLLGEIYNHVERLVAYYGCNGQGCHFPYNFQLITLPWNARSIDTAIRRYESLLPPGAWPNWVLGNHDRHRIATRVGPVQARVAAVLLLTLRGTPTLYYGDEIGMHDVPIPLDQAQDPWEKNLPGLGLGRDPQRTPMQWNMDTTAGFTMGRPWLPVAEDCNTVNVDVQRGDPASLLTLYRRLIALRRSEPALQAGAWEPVDGHGDVLAYLRTDDKRRFLVALNLGLETQSLTMERKISGTVVLSTHAKREGGQVTRTLVLQGGEGTVVQMA